MCPIASVSRKRGTISWTTVKAFSGTRGSGVEVGVPGVMPGALEEIERVEERGPRPEPAFGDLGGTLARADEPGLGGGDRRERPGVELRQHIDRGPKPRCAEPPVGGHAQATVAGADAIGARILRQ